MHLHDHDETNAPHQEKENRPTDGSAHLSRGDWLGLVENSDRSREHIEHVVPGFTQYNARVRQPYSENDRYRGKSNQPASKCIVITIEPARTDAVH